MDPTQSLRQTLSDAKRETIEVNGRKIHIVDLYGTFKEGGMRGPQIDRKGYRMLGSVAETDSEVMVFVKLTGPAATVTENEEAFMSLVKSMNIKESAWAHALHSRMASIVC